VGGAAVALLVLLVLEINRRPGYEIRCGPPGLQVKVYCFGLAWTHFMASKELEELRVEKPTNSFARIAAISDRKIFRFARGVGETEAKYMRGVLIKALAK